jgi:predicted ATPase
VVVHLCDSIRDVSLKSTVRRIAATLNDLDLKTYRTELDDWAQSIKENVDFLVAKRVEEEARNNSRFRALSHRQQRIAAKWKVLDMCSEYDYETTWKQIRKTGTTTLFAQTAEYEQWETRSGSSGLLYLGKLGCGKSVTMANIVEDLNIQDEERNVTIAYFFCRHNLPESLEARTVPWFVSCSCLFRTFLILQTLAVTFNTGNLWTTKAWRHY